MRSAKRRYRGRSPLAQYIAPEKRERTRACRIETPLDAVLDRRNIIQAWRRVLDAARKVRTPRLAADEDGCWRSGIVTANPRSG